MSYILFHLLYEVFYYYSTNEFQSTIWKEPIKIQNEKYTFSDFIMLLLSYINTNEESNNYTDNILFIKHLHQQTIYFILYLLTLPNWSDKVFDIFNEILTQSLTNYNENNCVSIYSIFTNTVNNILTYGTIVKYYNKNNESDNNNNNNCYYGIINDIKYNRTNRNINCIVNPLEYNNNDKNENDFIDIIYNNNNNKDNNDILIDLYNILYTEESNNSIVYSEDFILLLFEHFSLLFDENQKYIFYSIILLLK